ncbi:MAG: tyrosine-type recombinase/integrase [Candidatus Bathyarchaeia archaeon]
MTEDEIEKMTKAARTPRDRAFVSVLYESGLRIGEMLSLKIKNVQLEEHGTILTVNGKAGIRRVRITS